MVERADSKPRSRIGRRQDGATESWRKYLSQELALPVEVVYTDARRQPLQIRPLAADASTRERKRACGLEVRMHAMFADAPPHVHRAVASWIRSGHRAPRACALLDDWILETLKTLPSRTSRASALHPQGKHSDLRALALDLAATELKLEFPTAHVLPDITWGRRGPSKSRYSLRLGSYDPEEGIVRIHTVLDQPAVPIWFVRYVLFHELLHAVLPPRRGSGTRWVHHSAEFKRRERRYPDFARSIAWERANMNAVIRSARCGTPLRLNESRPVARAKAPALPKSSWIQAWLFPA